MTHRYLLGTICVLIAIVGCASTTVQAPTSVVWILETTDRIGGHPVQVLGSPRVIAAGHLRAVCFDGESDAIFIPTNPIAGWGQFTIEALIKPDATGPQEQRFLHIQDDEERRLLLETRLIPNAGWALDTFLYASPDQRLTLLDRERLHPADDWHWVALTFDGSTMAHYVNGRRELQGQIAFEPMTNGRTSIGVRLNQVSWYKGCIREIRFTPQVLTAPGTRGVGLEPDGTAVRGSGRHYSLPHTSTH